MHVEGSKYSQTRLKAPRTNPLESSLLYEQAPSSATTTIDVPLLLAKLFEDGRHEYNVFIASHSASELRTGLAYRRLWTEEIV